MRIVLAGATGFLGRPLTARLIEDGHELTILTRQSGPDPSPPTTPSATLPRTRFVTWIPTSVREMEPIVDAADAVINLAGEALDAQRWTAERKARLVSSRTDAARTLAQAIRNSRTPPPLFINSSAIGYYGSHSNDIVDESTPPGSDFLARLCVEWEAAAQTAASAHTRVVSLRTGLVIDKDGGALSRMLLPFRVGLGGRLGSGRQYWSWIHRADWVDLVRFVLGTPAAAGSINATAPQPVTNQEFSRALGRALHRPAIFPAPAFALRLVFGEMADAMILSGQRVVPTVATKLGFAFRYVDLPSALNAILG